MNRRWQCRRTTPYLLVLTAALVVPLVLLAGCNSPTYTNNEEQPNPPVDDPQARAVEQEEIAADVGDTIAANINWGNLQGSLAALVPILEQELGDRVADVESGNDFITVVHTGGTRETWFYNPLFVKPDAAPVQARAAVGTKAVVGSQNAVVMDVLANDPVFAAQHGAVLGAIRAELAAMGFNVQRVDGASANINSFKQLGGAGAVFIITHGLAISNHYYLQTGEAVSVANRIAYTNDWNGGLLRPSHVIYQSQSGTGVAAGTWMVSELFFNREYNAGAFPGSLFYNGACQGATNTALSTVLENKGVACYIGWSQSQGISPWHAHALFGMMSDGSDVSAAMGLVPDDLALWLNPPAVPQLGPNSDDGTQLKNLGAGALAVNIVSPANGAEIQAASVDVQGTVTPTGNGFSATIEVNGVTTALPLAANGSFNVNVNLISGANTIRVAALSALGGGTDSVAVTRTEAPPENAFDITLSWNDADVRADLHVVRLTDPAALATMPLWTAAQWALFFGTEDCSILRPAPDWGGQWVASGAQEQTISLQTAPGTGTTYAVLAHYHGLLPAGGPSDALPVTVNVKTPTMDQDYTNTLTNGGALGGANPYDIYGVGTLTLPGSLFSTAVSGVFTVTP